MRISDWISELCSSDLFTGRSSIVAYRNVEDFPLIVTVALDRNEALAGWRRFVWVVALANFLVGALILLLYSVVARRRLERQRSEEHTSELQSLMRISYAVFCLKKKTKHTYTHINI